MAQGVDYLLLDKFELKLSRGKSKVIGRGKQENTDRHNIKNVPVWWKKSKRFAIYYVGIRIVNQKLRNTVVQYWIELLINMDYRKILNESTGNLQNLQKNAPDEMDWSKVEMTMI